MCKSDLKIHNRRYIGSKASLVNSIVNIIDLYYKGEKLCFYEPFGGTGVVSYEMFKKKNKVIINDLLYCNYVPYMAWFLNEEFDETKLLNIIENYNKLNPEYIEDNYFSNYFSNKYFHKNDAKIIGFIREDIEKKKKTFTKKEYYILLTSLLYSADKIANTCGHFESYLKKEIKEKGVILKLPSIEVKGETEIYCEDANKLSLRIKSDVAYIDPPYNSRQYINFYHILENLARWEKPIEFEGDSMKFKRNHLKSEYSKSNAKNTFKNLIDNLNSKLIIVSYNNTYTAKSIASNNKIKESDLIEILKNKGKLTIKEIPYKSFNAGKTKFINHKEKLYICEVI